MKKEEKCTHNATKFFNLYRYELQATNQIFKDTIDLYPSELHSTAQTNRNYNNDASENDQCNDDDQYFQKPSLQPLKKQEPQPIKTSQFKNYYPLTPQKKSFQEKDNGKSKPSRSSNSKSKSSKYKKDQDYQLRNHYSSQIYSFSEQNSKSQQKKAIFFDEKVKQQGSKKQRLGDLKKDCRKQKRGLANISLKVKNIVAKRTKLTYKQVSDEVLKQSADFLPLETEKRQQESKNIRRRVYDALNVLVSVGILGKQQRCVVLTELTNVPGKKLSSSWETINQKTKILHEKQKNYSQKLKNLKLLKRHYESVTILRQRNEKILKLQLDSKWEKFYFPLICLVPKPLESKKMKIDIQKCEGEQSLKRIIITGKNLNLFTDINAVQYLNLQRQSTLIDQLDDKINDFAEQISLLPDIKRKSQDNSKLLD